MAQRLLCRQSQELPPCTICDEYGGLHYTGFPGGREFFTGGDGGFDCRMGDVEAPIIYLLTGFPVDGAQVCESRDRESARDLF